MICSVCQANAAMEGCSYCKMCEEAMSKECYELLMEMTPAQLQELADSIKTDMGTEAGRIAQRLVDVVIAESGGANLARPS